MHGMYCNIRIYAYMYVDVRSTLNRGKGYQGQTGLVLNVGFILNQNYRV